jgi:hypothetical protein
VPGFLRYAPRVMDPRSIGRGEEDDTERFRRMTPAERLALFLELCALTDSIVRSRPDADAIRAETPRSAESEALWARLMEQKRCR